MAGDSSQETPQSPEEQPAYVRQELDQEDISHEGDYRQPDPSSSESASMHMGAVDTEVVPVTPPMSGPADLVGEHNENAQGNETGHTQTGGETVDPRDELTPG